MKNMKPGFLLKTTTWENDADNYSTIENQGLLEHEVKFFLKVAELFYSCHGSKETRFGNADKYGYRKEDFPIEGPYPDRSTEKYRREDDMMLPVVLKKVIDDHIEENGSVPGYWDYRKCDGDMSTRGDFMDLFSDLLYDFIGSWADGEYWRVFDSYEVFLVPNEIQNVTSDFKV